MPNTNCLEGLACPKCGVEEPLQITGTAVFVVLDDGTDSYSGVEWEGTSSCGCPACGFEGIVDDFVKEEVQ